MAIMEDTIARLGALTDRQLTHARSLTYMRWLSALYDADGMTGEAVFRFGLKYPRAQDLDLIQKAAIAPGVTTDATWAGPLAPLKPLTDAFLEYVRPRTLVGKIQNLRHVPFNISMASQTTGGTYGWVGQNKPKPVTKADYATVTLPFAKASGIVIVSEELATLSKPGAEVALRTELAAGVAQFLDGQFVDPTVAAVSNVSPASITNGATSVAASGTSAAAALTDIKALIASFTTANPDVEFAVLLMTPSLAVALAVATGYPNLGLSGGTLFGIPVITSTMCGTTIIILDAQGILIADDGQIEITASRNATVQLDSAPAEPTVNTTVLVSLWQMNLAGFRVDRFITWVRGRASAVRYISGASYV